MSRKFEIDMERTLVIVNDHPSGLQRTIDARDWGFRHMFHPTNYAPGTGDHYSLKKTCSMSENVYFDGVTMEKAILTYEGRRSLLKQLMHVATVYYEFPPLWKAGNRFHMSARKYTAMTKAPLLPAAPRKTASLLDSLQRCGAPCSVMEAQRYTWAAYVQLSKL